MTNEITLLQGRKHLGPLDRAVINSYNAKINFARASMLQKHIEELDEIEKELNSDDLTEIEKMMMKSVYLLKEEQLYDFLGVPNGKDENDKLFKT
jgi:hypothetical protein